MQKKMNLSGSNAVPGFRGIFYRGPALRGRPMRSPCFQDHAMSAKITEIVIDIQRVPFPVLPVYKLLNCFFELAEIRRFNDVGL